MPIVAPRAETGRTTAEPRPAARVVLSHPGNAPFVQHAARALEEAGLLSAYVTTFVYQRDSALGRSLRGALSLLIRPLDACARLDFPWTLIIAGGGEDAYLRSIAARIRVLGLGRKAIMVGEVLDDAKERVFQQADVCVAPSFTENFAIVVAEALAHAVPVIAGRGTPWQGVEPHGCGLWIDNSPESIAAAITRLRSAPLRDMGMRGREWMQREFSWDTIGARMLDVYTGLLAEAR